MPLIFRFRTNTQKLQTYHHFKKFTSSVLKHSPTEKKTELDFHPSQSSDH